MNPAPTVADRDPGPPGLAARVPWWRRPWIVPLWAVTAIFIVWRVPDYLGFTPEKSLVALRSHEHYLVMSAHVALGTVALVCCCLQMWPWLRRNRPRAHRISGRIYVAAVIPGSLLALATSVQSMVPVPGRIGNVMLSLLWLGTTLVGFRMARRRRFAEHRRWMIRSFALCFSIVVNRLWTALWFAVLMPFYPAVDVAFWMDVAVASIWSSLLVNVLLAEWWIERTSRPRRPTGPRRDTPVP
ncbi:putative membrane protein DUF2306 [Stackebrandtia albiflava]|uniref:Putative membrane protein DUF2306 n=1 Tax=Stackebrandtia albiflava TaxID=406432 RepID=A0A562V9W0_9ACTN|nr:DUF2306 domain-containing protein [Stackebrandtia albiflava]TWJ14664.1 putative membrane protein DUF2306 [Stackebrandtia albiflava]